MKPPAPVTNTRLPFRLIAPPLLYGCADPGLYVSKEFFPIRRGATPSSASDALAFRPSRQHFCQAAHHDLEPARVRASVWAAR
jgi:hypothetical protein